MNPTIRAEAPGDAPAIESLTRAAFEHAPHSSGTEAQIVAALRDGGKLSVSLVAEVDGKIVGHVAVSPVTVSDGTSGWFGLGPVSVSPLNQRQGIGAKLIRAALSELMRLDAAGCVLVGDPGYYARFGFEATDGLELPGVPRQYFQAIAFGDHVPRGCVKYDDAFSAAS